MKKIMLVDDDEGVCYVFKETLESGGYNVIEAGGGEECLEILKHEKPDLILMDVMMPGMDGWDVVKKIREDGSTKDITICMLTSKSRAKDRMKSLADADADWHIAKPVKKKILLWTVQWLLKNPNTNLKKMLKEKRDMWD